MLNMTWVWVANEEKVKTEYQALHQSVITLWQEQTVYGCQALKMQFIKMYSDRGSCPVYCRGFEPDDL